MPSTFATYCSMLLGVNWFLPRLGEVFAAQGITAATVERVVFGTLSMRQVDPSGRLTAVDVKYELRELRHIADFLDALVTKNQRCMLAKVRPEFELVFLLRDGTQRHFRVTDTIVRPDRPASALCESWRFSEDALTPFLPPEAKFPRKYRPPRAPVH